MEYLSVKQTAAKWNMSARFVQRRCMEGRIDGATKIGTSWVIPASAKKPNDMRRTVSKEKLLADTQANKNKHDIMPLMNAVFTIGGCKEYIAAIEDKDEKNIATAEYFYYTGNARKCSDIAEKYIKSEIFELRVSALWLYAMSNLSLDKLNNTKKALKFVKEIYDNTNDDSPKLERALAICLYNAVLTQFHLLKPKDIPETQDYMRQLPAGLRYFICFSQAYFAYNNNLYGTSIGMAEIALALDDVKYPIARIYLHLICTMCYIHIGYTHLSEIHLNKALHYAKPDKFVMPFGELHMELCGMLEAVVKKKAPEDFNKIINVAKGYSSGWLRLHNEITGDNIPTDLTPTEYTIAMLVARKWQSKEIAAHLGITENSVNKSVSETMSKMGVSKRAEIKKIMLPR